MDAGAPADQPHGEGEPFAAGPEGGGPARSGWAKWMRWVAAAGLTAVLAAGAVTYLGGTDDRGGDVVVASSEPGSADEDPGAGGRSDGPGGLGTFGTVTAVDGTTLTVDAMARPTDGSSEGATEVVTVEVTDETTVTETVEGALEDLAVGDNVMVMGEEGADGVTATTIMDTGDEAGGFRGPAGDDLAPPDGDFEPPEDGDLTPPEGGFPDGEGQGASPGGGTFGEITGIDGTTLTVQTAEGEEVVVVVSDDTTITVTRTITVADLTTGDSITVMGETEGDVVTATSIRRGDLDGFGGGAGRPGMAPPDGAPSDDAASSDDVPPTTA